MSDLTDLVDELDALLLELNSSLRSGGRGVDREAPTLLLDISGLVDKLRWGLIAQEIGEDQALGEDAVPPSGAR